MSLEGKTIVAIDDTPSIRTFLRVSLQDEGAAFFEAATGEAGVALCAEKAPDLVVLDLGLPDIDGLDVLPRIKQLNQHAAPAVLILSVRKGKETIDKAYQLGADGYVTKPFMVDDLLEVIARTLTH